MRNQIVTVFGGSGFLGRHTVRALARRGYRIRVATRDPNTAHHLPPMGSVGQIQLFRANVRRLEDISAAVKGASAVVNLVGILFERGEQSFEAIHVTAPGAIAEAARAASMQRVIHVSSLGADLSSISSYAQTKAMGEQRLREAYQESTIFRPSIVFGPEDKFFNRFAGMARLSPALPLIGGGHTMFQPVFVGDVAEAIARSLERADLAGQTFELGGPNIYSFKDLMQFVLRETDRKRLLLPLPFPLASLMFGLLQFFPGSPFSADQVRILRTDNVVSPGMLTFENLGIVPTSVEAEVPSYLWRFRPKGQYEAEVEEREEEASVDPA